MGQDDVAGELGIEDAAARIRQLQGEILELEDRIMSLVDRFEPPPALVGLRDRLETVPMAKSVAGLIIDWEALLARSNAVSEDDVDLLAALVHFVGDLLAIQPEGIDERWVHHLRGYLESERSKIS